MPEKGVNAEEKAEKQGISTGEKFTKQGVNAEEKAEKQGISTGEKFTK